MNAVAHHSVPTEHRWGHRFPLDVPVRLIVGGRAMGQGLLRNASISGGMIESALELPVFTNLMVKLPKGAELAAWVVRRVPHGLGVEWRDMACAEINALLG
jgi:hypothetical protein